MKPDIKRWDVWYADFPFDENDGQSKDRPVVILSTKPMLALTVKITSKDKRDYDPYDIQLKYLSGTGLTMESVVRVDKLSVISISQFRRKTGAVHPQDAMNIYQTFVKYLNYLRGVESDIARESITDRSYTELTSFFGTDHIPDC